MNLGAALPKCRIDWDDDPYSSDLIGQCRDALPRVLQAYRPPAWPTVTASMTAVAGAIRRLVRLPERSVLRRLARILYRRLNWVSLEIVYGTELMSVPVPDAAHDFKPILDFLGRAK